MIIADFAKGKVSTRKAKLKQMLDGDQVQNTLPGNPTPAQRTMRGVKKTKNGGVTVANGFASASN